MRKHILKAMLAIAVLGLSACEKELEEESAASAVSGPPDSSLTVVTRAGGADEVVSYPVTVYVFPGGSNDCVATAGLASADDALRLELSSGSYDIYAIGGAAADTYTVPEQSEITPASEVVLRDGKNHADLMTAKSTVTLRKGEQNTLTLSMRRQVLELSSVIVRQIPDDVTAVSIAVSPSYKGLRVNGTPGTESTQDYPLVKTGTGIWAMPAPRYLMVASESASVTVRLTRDGATRSYTYSCADRLRSNYKFSVTATYTEEQAIAVEGVVTGVAWAGSEQIRFTFDESGTETDQSDETDQSSDSGDGGSGTPADTDDDVPAVRTLYNGCYVLSVTATDAGHDAVLVYPSDLTVDPAEKTEADVLTEINTALAALSLNGITAWRLPNAEEGDRLGKDFNNIKSVFGSSGTPLDTDGNYFYVDDGKLHVFVTGTGTIPGQYYTRGSLVRPVATVHFSK